MAISTKYTSLRKLSRWLRLRGTLRELDGDKGQQNFTPLERTGLVDTGVMQLVRQHTSSDRPHDPIRA